MKSFQEFAVKYNIVGEIKKETVSLIDQSFLIICQNNLDYEILPKTLIQQYKAFHQYEYPQIQLKKYLIKNDFNPLFQSLLLSILKQILNNTCCFEKAHSLVYYSSFLFSGETLYDRCLKLINLLYELIRLFLDKEQHFKEMFSYPIRVIEKKFLNF